MQKPPDELVRRRALEDLGSSNGTFLNGALVDPEAPIRLQDATS